jgi:hypothetical protein
LDFDVAALVLVEVEPVVVGDAGLLLLVAAVEGTRVYRRTLLCRREPQPSARMSSFAGQGTLIRFASFHSGITDPDQEKFHAFQTCYLGSRGRLVVRSDGNRIGADRPGAAGRGRIS